MKFIKRHISLIFPMVAILLGLEFFIVFDRTTEGYERSLQDKYAMLVVAKDEMSIDDFKSWDAHVFKVAEIEKSKIIKRVDSSFTKSGSSTIEKKMPNFYSIKLNKYLNESELELVKQNFMKSEKVTRVESFDTLHNSNYGLFSFIKFSFQTFILFMTIIGFFLIVKQMEVWNFMHTERMKVMDIFGASLFLRSKVLIVMGIIDAVISAIIASLVFYIIQNVWMKGQNIAIIEDNVNSLFSFNDIFILSFVSIVIVMIAVFLVVINVKEE
ncbi:cell division protein FtsX [Sulfurovum sp. bin170]|uniref:cell division protein FtsX n=1 Tax=Sulfurovum sp. bin170 TaxID=2695268 RepID=UPI0013DEB59C|nr:cell division protein FtsX [Sulfurovum sp. bin170]NEW60551.1 cell division protein FtsX [Sulfurovum sp. bin170]